ncbi:MAG: Rrf2 family transcriptional regulator [Dehalococcoidales bacterium]|nr:Rrf2 family transcriptional regulator [Dehalococcoidales bacterium]
MKISKKGEYALKAMIELAVNYDKGEPVTLINEVAKRKAIPQKYLEQILLSLKRAGLLDAKRGVGGGYSLSSPPEKISLGQIIRAIEGPLAPMGCASISAHVSCPDESLCGLNSVMLEVREAISGILDNTSLKDLVKRTADLVEKRNNISSYAI